MTDEKPVLFDYFNDTADVLMSHYNRSAKQKSSINIGNNRELFCSDFLIKTLPSKLSIKTGEIWDSLKNKTGQEDIVIVRDDCPVINIGSSDIYLVEGVFAVLEVKSNLDRNKIIEAGENFLKLKNLRSNTANVISSGNTLNRPLRIVFAYKSANWDIIVDEIKNKGWQDLFDLICVLDKGVLIKKDGLLKWNDDKNFLIIDGKASSLGFLYYYLVSHSTTFCARSLLLNPYFEPFVLWADDV